jgi:hypothetical protein
MAKNVCKFSYLLLNCAALYWLRLLVRSSPVHVPTAASPKATRKQEAASEQSVIDKVGAWHPIHGQGWQWGMIPD